MRSCVTDTKRSKGIAVMVHTTTSRDLKFGHTCSLVLRIEMVQRKGKLRNNMLDLT